MNGKFPPPQPAFPAFLAWLAHNPTGIPQRQALRLAAIGGVLGLLGGIVTSWLLGFWPIRPLWALGLGIGSGILSGATLGALGMVLLAYAIDRWVLAGEHLIGYSSVIRMLLHAGELSFLGALGGGLGGGIRGAVAGLLTGMLGGSLAGGLIYRIRGLGWSLGLTVGLVTGAIGGALGGAIAGLGQS
jgi:hypothetical protein